MNRKDTKQSKEISTILILGFIHFLLGSGFVLLTLFENSEGPALEKSQIAFAMLIASAMYFLGYVLVHKIEDTGMGDLFWLRDLLLIPLALCYFGEIAFFYDVEYDFRITLFSTFTIMGSILLSTRALISKE